MTLPTTTSAVTYAGNGVTTRFDWTFPIPSGALAVYRTEDNVAVLVDPSAYSVSGLDDPNGGTVSFAQAPALGQTITIKRNVALTQDMALVTGSAFYAEVVEGAFDRATMQIQQLAEEMGRAVQVPIGSDVDPADYLDAAAQSEAAAAGSASSAATAAGNAMTAQAGSEAARDEAVAAKEEVEEALQSLAQATETISGISRQATIAEATSGTSTTPAALPHVTPEGVAAAVSATRWKSRAIGEPFAIWGHLVGAEIPPTAEGGPRFVKLTASDAYNDGLLSGESVSGSAPDVIATAVIALSGSPLYGQTVRLVNTERRFIRGGASGEVEGDAIRNITGAFSLHSGTYIDGSGPLGAFAVSEDGSDYAMRNDAALRAGRKYTFAASNVVPTATENRSRNISATYYLRVR